MLEKELAAFTIARNEAFFLPRWLAHYGQLDAQIYLLDHESNDGSTASLPAGVRRLVIHREQTDDVGWMLRTVEKMFADLLTVHRRVIFAEVDEFLVPRTGRLQSFLDAHPAPEVITAEGIDVCQPKDRTQFDRTAGLLKQSVWKCNVRYDKTLIASQPMTWEPGFHWTGSGCPRPAPHPELRLLHFHYVDREVAWERLVSRMAGREPTPGEWGWQNKIRDRAVFDKHFDEAIDGCWQIPTECKELL